MQRFGCIAANQDTARGVGTQARTFTTNTRTRWVPCNLTPPPPPPNHHMYSAIHTTGGRQRPTPRAPRTSGAPCVEVSNTRVGVSDTCRQPVRGGPSNQSGIKSPFARPQVAGIRQPRVQIKGMHQGDSLPRLGLVGVAGTRRGLVFKAHRPVYHSTLGSRGIKRKTKRGFWTSGGNEQLFVL